jgi:histone deacetylase 1/2
MELLQGDTQSSANSMSRGGRGGGGRDGRGRGRGGGNGGRGGFGRGNDNKNNGNRPTCQLCGKIGHTVIKCWKRFDTSFTGEEKVAGAATSYGVDTNWYLDTGATDHITGELEKLSVKEKYNGNDQVHTANGTGMDINCVGHTTIRSSNRNFLLRNILHIPTAQKNLVSVHHFLRDNHAFMETYPHVFFIKDLATRKLLLQGRCRGGLYPLPSSHSTSMNKQAHSVVKPSTARWHHRLGHPSFAVVNRVISQNNLPVIPDSSQASVCDACQQGKCHQLPFQKSTSVSAGPLDLVYSDVWGPAPNSVGNKSYYVSFIDDYSKHVWLYLLKYKSEVFEKFRDFQNLVERLLERKIKVVQTDWGGEYQRLNTFFQRIGIEHHVSCPHTHQQNGAAERKHRHIVEVGLSLLAQASMPLKFWDEAFVTATYLINRTPSKVIDYTTPLERLLHVKPNYAALRVFGCACWPNLRPYNTHKLSFRSKRCVFLGYSTLHKGFKCLDPSSGRVYISRDVTFDEQVYPFASLHTNAGAKLRAEILLLPSHLQPSSSFGSGGELLVEPLVNNHNPNPDTNQNDEISAAVINSGDGDANAAQNFSFNGAETRSNGQYFMQDAQPASSAQGSMDPSHQQSPSCQQAADARQPTAGAAGADLHEAASPVGEGQMQELEPELSSSHGSGTPTGEPAPGSSAATNSGDSTQDPETSTEAFAVPEETAVTAPVGPVTRAQRGIRKRKEYTDGTVRYGFFDRNR